MISLSLTNPGGEGAFSSSKHFTFSQIPFSFMTGSPFSLHTGKQAQSGSRQPQLWKIFQCHPAKRPSELTELEICLWVHHMAEAAASRFVICVVLQEFPFLLLPCLSPASLTLMERSMYSPGHPSYSSSSFNFKYLSFSFYRSALPSLFYMSLHV